MDQNTQDQDQKVNVLQIRCKISTILLIKLRSLGKTETRLPMKTPVVFIIVLYIYIIL